MSESAIWVKVYPETPTADTGVGEWAKVSGGTVTTVNNPDGSVDEVHTFTASGTLTVDSPGYARVLVCGGGGGGVNIGGGGGVRFGIFALPAGAVPVTVGLGAVNLPGGDSALGSIVNVGGGANGSWSLNGKSVGFGGGGGAPGGDPRGGGGAGGSAPADAQYGVGIVNDITGTAVEYGRGGQSGVATATLPGQGVHTASGKGGDGRVIVRVRKTAPTVSTIAATGGTEDTFVGDGVIGESGVTYKRHTFTADGTLTVAQAGEVDLILVGAGGTTGHSNTAAEQIGAGAGGGVLQARVTLSAGAHPVGIGVAATTGRALPGGPTYVGQFSVPGGGTGSSNRNGPGGDGGSGGGGGDGTGVGGKGIPGIGNNGGNGGGNPDGGGGGGANGPGVGPVGGAGRSIWGVEYGKGGSVVSTGLSGSPVANSGSGESISQGNNSRIVAASGKAFIFYPA